MPSLSKIVVAACMLALFAAPMTAEAKPKKKPTASQGTGVKWSNARAYEAARAHNVDPAGDYKGYPDWARWALSPKSGGRVN